MTTNKTITIFNARYQASTRSEVYLPTVIQNVSFYESHASSATDSVWTDDSAYKFRIPFFGCEIQDDRPYMEADAFYRSKAEGWTIRKGDFVMLKAYAGDKTSLTMTDLKALGEKLIVVTDFADNTIRGSNAVKHWRMGGRE